MLLDPSKKISDGDVLDLTISKPKKASLKPYKYKLDCIAFDDEPEAEIANTNPSSYEKNPS